MDIRIRIHGQLLVVAIVCLNLEIGVCVTSDYRNGGVHPHRKHFPKVGPAHLGLSPFGPGLSGPGTIWALRSWAPGHLGPARIGTCFLWGCGTSPLQNGIRIQVSTFEVAGRAPRAAYKVRC